MKVFVGEFSASDLMTGKDRLMVAAKQAETGLKYTSTEFVRRSGKIVGLKIWVCDLDEISV